MLTARGLETKILDKESRYWNKTIPSIDSFESGAAVAAHAEEMRLERIKIIASDDSVDNDIRETFKRILIDEVFHARAFRSMAGDKSFTEATENHKQGMIEIGLIPSF